MSINTGMDKEDVVYIPTEYYSAVKTNEIVPFAETWIDLGIVILSEVSQKEKNKYCISSVQFSRSVVSDSL